MAQTGLAANRPRRRQAEIWSDEVSWEPEPRPRRTGFAPDELVQRPAPRARPPRARGERPHHPEDAAWLEATAAIFERAPAPVRAATANAPVPVAAAAGASVPLPAAAPEHPDEPPAPALAAAPPAAATRRTVKIQGRGAERPVPRRSSEVSRRSSAEVPRRSTAAAPRRPAPAWHERPSFHADRVAMWAVVLGILLVIVAATSAHAAVLTHALH
jgi:hypothetical protein